MERAVRLIRKNKYSRRIMNDDELARAIWPAAVGKAIASHTSRVKLVRSTLVVEVEDHIWQRQLHTLSLQILDRIRRLSGGDEIESLEFRVGVPRRQPQRAESNQSSLFPEKPIDDEAERIQDPVMKRVYQMSRRKATA